MAKGGLGAVARRCIRASVPWAACPPMLPPRHGQASCPWHTGWRDPLRRIRRQAFLRDVQMAEDLDAGYNRRLEASSAALSRSASDWMDATPARCGALASGEDHCRDWIMASSSSFISNRASPSKHTSPPAERSAIRAGSRGRF
jgi:hypothetical protein